jgi:hypothetical protein
VGASCAWAETTNTSSNAKLVIRDIEPFGSPVLFMSTQKFERMVLSFASLHEKVVCGDRAAGFSPNIDE